VLPGVDFSIVVKTSVRRGAKALVCDVWTYGGKVIEFHKFSMNLKITRIAFGTTRK